MAKVSTAIKDLSKANLEKHSFDKITYWKEPDGWINSPKTKFISQNYTYLKLKLEELKNPKTDYFVSSNGLNQFIFELIECFLKYFTYILKKMINVLK